MKTCAQNSLLLPSLLAGFGLMLAGRVMAQSFTTLHNFTPTESPNGILLLSDNSLYGTIGGLVGSGSGSVFAINTDGTAFTNLHIFTASTGSNSEHYPINRDGAGPQGALTASGNTLYGVTGYGGSSGNGTIFKINKDGTGFTNLHFFKAGRPISFGNFDYDYTNSDGIGPNGYMILSGKTLYGTTQLGGTGGQGTVFAVNIDGTGFTNLHSFDQPDPPYSVFNTEGSGPIGLVLSGNTLYGASGGTPITCCGTVFSIDTDGSAFTVLYSFTRLDPTYYTNSDGLVPNGILILSGNTLYGAAQRGGSSGNGTVFALNTDGTGFTNLHTFTATPALPYEIGINSDGAWPFAGLALSGSTLYGMALMGGTSGNGTIFSLALGPVSPPQLTLTTISPDVILTWPISYGAFTLQSTTNLGSPTIWTTVSPGSVIVNGQNTVTNPIYGTQQLFRLSL